MTDKVIDIHSKAPVDIGVDEEGKIIKTLFVDSFQHIIDKRPTSLVMAYECDSEAGTAVLNCTLKDSIYLLGLLQSRINATAQESVEVQ